MAGHRVEIIGRLVDYESLPKESEYELARKLLDGKIVINWCFGEKVLLAESIRRM